MTKHVEFMNVICILSRSASAGKYIDCKHMYDINKVLFNYVQFRDAYSTTGKKIPINSLLT